MDNYNMPSGQNNRPDEYIQNMNNDFRPGRNYIKPNSFATAAQVCGIIGVVSVFTMTIYPAIVLGALAVIFAVLSRGSEKKYSDRARTGIISGLVAIGIDLALVAATLMLIFSNGEFKKQLNDACVQMYGESFDDLFEDAMKGESDFDPYSYSFSKM